MVNPGGGSGAREGLASSSQNMTGDTVVSRASQGPFKGCECGQEHATSASRNTLTEEDLKAFVMDNWAPALQAAFGDQWRDQFQPENCGGFLGQNGSLDTDVFEGLLPKSLVGASREDAERPKIGGNGENEEGSRSGVGEEPDSDGGVYNRAFESRAMEDELHTLEMTAGFTDTLRSSLPRRSVKIKRPGRNNPKSSVPANLRTSMQRLSINDAKAALATPPVKEEPPRGQKRSANSLFSDAPSQSVMEYLDSLEDSLPSTPSVAGADFGSLSSPSGTSHLNPSDQAARLNDYPGLQGASPVPSSDCVPPFYEIEGGWNRSPLHMAAATGRADVVQQLLLAGVDASTWLPVNGSGFSLISEEHREGGSQHSSAQRSDPNGVPRPRQLESQDTLRRASSDAVATIQPGLVDRMSNMMQISNKRPRSEGSSPSVSFSHQQPVQINPMSFDYCTALHLAAYYGHWPVVQQLVESGKCDPAQLFAARNAQGATALHMAAHRGHAQAVQCMGKFSQCDLNAVDNEGRTALHHAAALGHTAVITELWTLGSNLEVADSLGWTALHHAAEAGHTEVVGILVIAGTNVQRVDTRGFTPAHLAASQGHVEVLDKLLMAGYDADTLASVSVLGGVYNTGSSCLHLAAQHGQLAMVERLLEAGANPRLADYRGCDALQCAAEGAHSEVFNLLLNAGCDPMGEDHLNATMLHYAANGGNWDIIQTLLDLGCNKDAVTKYGRTVLHYAAYNGHKAALEKLIDLGCNINHADNEGNTPWHAAAQSSNLNVLQRLLEYGCPLNATNNLKCTALHYAARSGCLEMVEMLLEEGDDVSVGCIDGKTALHYAAQMGQEAVAVRLLQGQPKFLVNRPDCANWLPLHYAAEKGSLPLVHMFLEAGSEVNAQTAEGWSPLHLAAKDCRLHVVNSLLAAGTDVSLVDVNGCTALHYAARIGDITLFQTLYRQSTDFYRLRDARGFSALHYAVEGGNKEIVNILLEDGLGPPSSAEKKPQREFTPLHLAARVGHMDLVPVLLDAGYAADGLDDEGRTPLHCAALGSQVVGWLHAAQVAGPKSVGGVPDHSAIATELLGQGVDPTALDDAMCTALHYASGSGDVAVVRHLISLGCSPTDVDQIGWNPLLWAAAGGHAPVIKELMQHGTDVRICDVRARGALHWAAEKGHVEAVDLLVEKLSELELDLHAQDTDGYSPAQLAANQGHVEVVGRILDASRNHMQKGFSALHLAVQNGLDRLVQQLLVLPSTAVDAKDADGLTALHWAATEGRTGIAHQLLQSRADVNATTNEGCTPLHKAAAAGHVEIVKMILSVAAQAVSQVVNAKSTNGVTALQQAAAEGHLEIVELLLNAGASLNAGGLSNATALYNAANGGHLAIVERLLRGGAEVDAKTGSGCTPLHAAASGGHTEVVKALLDAGADADLQAQNGSAAVHNAAGNGHEGPVEVLVAAGCDVDIQNSGGSTALHVAATKGHTKVVEVLIAAGADVHIRNGKALTAVGSATNNGHAEAVLKLVSHGAAWRNLPDINVVRTICRKTNYKPSHFSGLLELAEKEKHRSKKKANSVDVNAGLTEEEVRARKEAADAQMAALIEAEEAKKAQEAQKKAKKRKKKKGKKAAGSAQATDEEDGEGEPEATVPSPQAPAAEPQAFANGNAREDSLEQPVQPAKNLAEPPEPLSASGKDSGSGKRADVKNQRQKGKRGNAKESQAADGGPSVRQQNHEAERSKQPKKPPKAQTELLERAAEPLEGGWTQVGHSGRANPTSAGPPAVAEAPTPRGQQRKQQGRPTEDHQGEGRQQTPRSNTKTGRQQGARGSETPRQGSQTAAARNLQGNGSSLPGHLKGSIRGEVASASARSAAPRAAAPPPPPKQAAQPPAAAAPPQRGPQQPQQAAPAARAQPPPASQGPCTSQAQSAARPPWRATQPQPPQAPPPTRPLISAQQPSPVRPSPPPSAPFTSTLPAHVPQATAPPVQALRLVPLTQHTEQNSLPLRTSAPEKPTPVVISTLNSAAPCWQPLTNTLPNGSGIDWSYQGSGLPQVAPLASAAQKMRNVEAAMSKMPLTLSSEGRGHAPAFMPPRVSSVQDLSLRCSSFDSSPGSHFGPGVATRITSSRTGSHDSESTLRSASSLAGVAPPPPVPPAGPSLGLSSFSPSIWGSAPSGRNGFLSTSAQLSSSKSKTERDLAYARDAGYFCPLTKTVIRDPVVASDGFTYERQAIEAWMKTNDRSPMDPEQLLDRNKELVPNLTMRAHLSMFYNSAHL